MPDENALEEEEVREAEDVHHQQLAVEEDPSFTRVESSSSSEVPAAVALPESSVPEDVNVDMEDAQSDLRQFQSAARFVIALGQAAYLYGSFGHTIESCLATVLQSFGYTGLFRVTQSEIMANMQMTPDSVPQFSTWFTPQEP